MSTKKGLFAIILLSFSVIFSLVYFNYFNKKLYIKDFKEIEEVEVLKKYNPNNENICYGNELKCKKISYKIKGKVNTDKVGTYKITYVAQFKKNKLVKSKKIKVIDTTKPELIIEGSFSNVCKNGKNSNVVVKAMDNYDGDITDKIEYKLDGNKAIYKVKDSSGNETKKTFYAIINDNEKPNIILNGDSTIYLAEGSNYKELGYTAIDNCDGDITKEVMIKGNIDTNLAGVYELNYSVMDSSNNINSVKRKVKVYPKNNYVPGSVGNKVIYLTFDDGPGPYTSRLLDILNNYNVKATFFVTGYNNGYNNLLKRETDEGHTVALHSYSHNYEAIYSSIDAYMTDLLKIQEKVTQYTGIESKIIRFPGGSSNTISRKYKTNIMTDLTQKVEEIGFRYFDWTIMSGDAGNTKDPNKIYENVTNAVKENEPNVVLMHDIKSYTVDSIERIIQFGLANGYTFAPLTMESPIVHQQVNN